MLDHLLPFFFQARQIHEIRTRIDVQHDKQQRGRQLDASWFKYRELPRDALLDSLRAELSRRELIHRRAQTFLGSVAILSAFTIGAIGSFPPHGCVSLTALLATSTAITMLFLAGAAWAAMQIIRPEQLYDLFLQSRMENDEPLTDDGFKDAVLYAIQMNQAYLLIFSAYSERSFRCLRNGFVCLMVVLLLLLLVKSLK